MKLKSFFRVFSEQEGIKSQKRSRDIKKELWDLEEKYQAKAIILGTRKNDPFCENLNHFSPTDIDKGWAPMMRVNPIINWSLSQVWDFIKTFGIPYCSLYDEGYTHLGNKANTVKNKYLMKEDGTYYPSSTCENLYENYSRKTYTARDEYLSTEIIVGVYDQDMPQEITQILPKATNLLSKKADNLHFFASNSDKIGSLLAAEIEKNITLIANNKHRTTINEILSKYATSKVKTIWL